MELGEIAVNSWGLKSPGICIWANLEVIRVRFLKRVQIIVGYRLHRYLTSQMVPSAIAILQEVVISWCAMIVLWIFRAVIPESAKTFEAYKKRKYQSHTQ